MIAATSFVRGPESADLISITVGQHFDDATERWEGREALVARHQSIRWTYGILRERVDAVSLGLLALGLEPGDRIAVSLLNCAEWTVIQYSAAKAGLILVGLNPTLRSDEMAYALNKVQCAALISASPTIPPLSENGVPSLRHVISLSAYSDGGGVNLDALIRMGADVDPGRLALIGSQVDPRAAASIQFTSGTTGAPKAATLSHYHLINAAQLGAERLGVSDTDRICAPVPLFHSFGMVAGNLLALSRGAAIVYPGAKYDPRAVLATVEAERCTVLYGVPSMFAAQLRHPDFAKFDLSSLRTGIIAGSPCPERLMRQVINAMHIPELVTAFGMTETSAAGLATARSDPLDRRVQTVGRVTAHTEIKIVDETGAVVPRGIAGEFCIRGFSVMLGYWNDGEATADAIDRDGWMHTGDLVALDDQGYGTVLGRLRDVINSGGEKILAGELESFLGGHPAIEVAQVFGVPDEVRGEAVCAWIKLKPGRTLTRGEVRAFCQGRMANYKVPRHVRVVGDFPMTATGKVKKHVMRERMMAETRSSI
jgi:fatty-acyl-CoA synthase